MNGSQWSKQQELLANAGTTSADAGEIVHPYLGAVFDPTHPPESTVAGQPVVINRLGFPHPTEPVQTRSADRFIVAVTGGSVAWQLTLIAGDELIRQLQAHPRLRDREIRIVCLAMGGHKQPQQLMGINYLLSLGGEFDLVVNLDGFNDLAVADWDFHRGISPVFPRAWPNKLPLGFDLANVGDQFRIWEVRGRRQRLAQSMVASWFRWSALRQLWWRSADRRLEVEEFGLSPRLSAGRLRDQTSFQRLGPREEFATESQRYARFVDIWADSSQVMHSIGEGQGFLYVHCLQPNQYDVGSKPLSDEERDLAFAESSEYRPAVEAGYPLLRAAGATLQTHGVRFHDLSQIFAGVEETLYGDDCCHFNREGNRRLAESVAAAVRLELDRMSD